MSWSIFKQEMKVKMLNPNWNDVSDFADFFTKKYDECMRRGLDNITQNTVIKGNTDLMRSTITIALNIGNQSKTELFYSKSLGLLGKGAIAYWTGAELGKVPPIIPAPGTVLNLSVVSNTVTNPGIWPSTPLPILPSISSDPFIDGFILMASIHLQSISGICNTISQYPPPASPGPAILLWNGFVVDTAVASPIRDVPTNEFGPNAGEIPVDAQELTPAEKAALLRKRLAEIDAELFINPNPELNAEIDKIKQELQNLGLETRIESTPFAGFVPQMVDDEPNQKTASKGKLREPFTSRNLNKGWEGKQVPVKRTKINPAIEGPKLKNKYGANMAKCMLANMEIEQPNGGFNNNMGGFDITDGGWKFESKYHDGYFVTTEGGTKKLKAFASFKNIDAFYEKVEGSFTRKGATSITNSTQYAEFYYQKWLGGDSATLQYFNNAPGISKARGGPWATLAQYRAGVKARFKEAYETVMKYVR